MLFEQLLRRPKPDPTVHVPKIALPACCASVVVLMLATKGGGGKSTISIHAAVAAATDGLSALIIDTDIDDDQMTCKRWANIRSHLSKPQPKVITCAAENTCQAVNWGRQKGYQVIIVDTSGRDRANMSSLVNAADFAVTPAQLSWLDLEAAGSLKRIWRSSNTPAAILLNGAINAHSSRTRSFQKRFGEIAPVFDTVLVRRVDYADPIALGLGVSEWSPGGAADIDIRYFLRDAVLRVAASKRANR